MSVPIVSVSFGPLHGGPAHGLPVFKINVARQDQSPRKFLSPEELVRGLSDARDTLKPKLSGILLNAVDTDISFDVYIAELLALLWDYRFLVSVRVGSSRRPGFLEDKYRIGVIVDPSWINFKVNDIYLHVSNDSDLFEPTILEHNKNSSKYLMIDKKISASALWRFLNDSAFLWAVVPRPLVEYEISIEDWLPEGVTG